MSISKWQRVGQYDDVAYVRRGTDECIAIVFKDKGGFRSQAEVNINDMARSRGFWGTTIYKTREAARREALRACGRHFRSIYRGL